MPPLLAIETEGWGEEGGLWEKVFIFLGWHFKITFIEINLNLGIVFNLYFTSLASFLEFYAA